MAVLAPLDQVELGAGVASAHSGVGREAGADRKRQSDPNEALELYARGYIQIGQLAKRAGVPIRMIRFYEAIGLIRPAARLANRYRIYDDGDVQTLRFVHGAHTLGFSSTEIKQLLVLYQNRRRSSRGVRRLALAHITALDRRMAELSGLRNTLLELARRCHRDSRPE